MILSDGTLKEKLKTREIVLEPTSENDIHCASIDCRLGNHFLIVDHHAMGIITLNDEIKYREIIADTITIPPHSFLLATTQEHLEIPDNITVFVEGRSSIGRMGLFIQNAGWVDPGWKGKITLELYNANSLPIKLEAGKRICQMVFCQMDKPAENPYKGKYQGQSNTVGSRIFKDTDKIILS